MSEYKIGDLVKIVHTGALYSTYDNKAEEFKLINWESGKNVEEGVIGKVVATDGIYYGVSTKEGDFIIGLNGIELVESKEKHIFKIGDVIKLKEGVYGSVESIFKRNKKVEITGINGDQVHYNNEDWFSAYWLKDMELESPKEKKQKLIENTKMNVEDLKKVDPKILKLAQEEVLKDRAEKTQKEAEEVLRQLYERKDEASKIVEYAGIDLKDIDKQLKVFEGKPVKK